LQPISFDWREGGARDLGFGAEAVAEVEPLLVTRNPNGEIEGVKYRQISTALVNAIKEQQAQIDEQSQLIKRQQSEIDALKRFICAKEAAAPFCPVKEGK